MKLLAICALLSSIAMFVMGILSTALDPDKGLKGGRWEKLTENEKRMRFAWVAIGALPSILLATMYLLWP